MHVIIIISNNKKYKNAITRLKEKIPMLIKEIKPIGKVGKNLLKDEKADDIIDRIIELPLRKACKIFKDKKIETNMSSANKKNLPKRGVQRIEKEDLKIDDKIHYFNPNFTVVGKGYAWIMINYDKLSDENKEKIFELQEELTEKRIWFVYSMYYVKFKTEEESYTDYKKRFDEKAFRLIYNNKYPRRAVFVRMPIDNETTVEEVENYFCELANKMFQQ